MTTIASRLQAVRRRIESATVEAGRSPGEVRLIAVSKTFSAQAVCEAFYAGQRAFGENYLQESLEKMAAVEALLRAFVVNEGGGPDVPTDKPASAGYASRGAHHLAGGEALAPTENVSDHHAARVASPERPLLRLPEWDEDSASAENISADHSSRVASPEGPLLRLPEWHFIGPIQSNKTRLIAENFSWVHSVDRLKIAKRLSDARPADFAPLNICLQVNVSGEDSKSGVSPKDTLPLALEIAQLPRLRLRGLMAVPEPTDDKTLLRRRFATVRENCERIADRGLTLDTLSMGMSDDLESAIAEGATMVRIGRAIFGERIMPKPR